MGNYSKAIGSVLGGIVGIVGAFGIPMEWATPEVQMGITTVVGALIGTFVSPANNPN